MQDMRLAAAVAAVQNAYAAAIDRRDWDALRQCFTDDASITFGMRLGRGGLDEFIEWAPPFHNRLARTLHQITTHTVVLAGASAAASCYLHALLVEPDGNEALAVYGYYEDILQCLDDDWRISSRTFHPVWLQRHPPERSQAR
jgi:ketosteroid isomerase-like protein